MNYIDTHHTYNIEKLKSDLGRKLHTTEIKGIKEVSEGEDNLHITLVVEGMIFKSHMKHAEVQTINTERHGLKNGEVELSVVAEFDTYEQHKKED